MTSNTSLCFREALDQLLRDDISERAYLGHILAHFRGVRHPDDENSYHAPEKRQTPWRTLRHHRYKHTAYSVLHASVESKYKPLSKKSTDALENLYFACANGYAHQFRQDYDRFMATSTLPKKLLLQPLAVLAAESGSAECLRICLDNGAKLNNVNITGAIEMWSSYADSVEMLELLYEKGWRRMRISDAFLSKMATNLLGRSYPGEPLQWLVGHGAKLRKKDIEDAVMHQIDETKMAVLISVDPEAATCFGSVHTAVQYWNPGVVKLLLEAGASPNGAGGGKSYEELGSMLTPLIEAISPLRLKLEELWD
jgi:hypothetical protein